MPKNISAILFKYFIVHRSRISLKLKISKLDFSETRRIVIVATTFRGSLKACDESLRLPESDLSESL